MALTYRLFPWGSGCVLAVAVGMLSFALTANHGLYSPWAISLLLGAGGLFGVSRVIGKERGGRGVERVLLAIVVAQGVAMVLSRPVNDLPGPGWGGWVRFWPYYVFAGVGVLAAVFPRRGMLLAAVGMFWCSGFWVIRCNPSPGVDVFVYQRDACEAILRLVNPYTLTFPNPNGADSLWTFAPGAATAERILFGYPYMPLTVVAVAPFHALFGDYRVGHLTFICVTAVLLGWGGGRAGVRIALTLLTFPRLHWVVEWGWNEPLLGMLLVGSLVAWSRGGGLTWLLLAGKQYMPLFGPVLWLRSDGGRGWGWWMWGGVALGVSLPLMVWDGGAFWSSAVALQFHQPFRPDALSIPALLHRMGIPVPPSWLPLPMTLGVTALLAWWVAPTSKDRMVAAWWRAVVYSVGLLTLFLLSKQAFMNYYFLLLVAWLTLLSFETTGGEAQMEPERLP